MSDDDKRVVVAAAFDRLASRVLSSSSAISDRTRAAVRNALAKLRSHIDGDPDWVDGMFIDRTVGRE